MSTDRNAGADDDRPLTARSVLASALLGSDPPWMPTSQLVRLAALFGVSDTGARVALTRMVAGGEALARDGGYALSGPLLERHALQRSRRRPGTHRWDGTWHLVVIASGARSPRERADARSALRTAGLAERREGLWMRPANIELELAAPVAATSDTWSARPAGDPAALVAELWDLDEWAARARVLRRRLDRSRPALARHDHRALAPGFELSAAVVRHLRRDPLLPDELAPRAWPSSALRASYDEWDDAYRRVLAAWHRAERTRSTSGATTAAVRAPRS